MKEKILVGGYTKRKSRGVYQFSFDKEKKELSDLTLVCEVSAPTYLAMDEAQHLYTVASNKRGYGGTAAFSYDSTTATASLLNSVLTAGTSDCYLSLDNERHLVYGANYHEGEVRVYRQLSDGSLLLTDSIKHSDHHGPRPEQTGSLCHFAGLTPDKRLAVCDLGNDAIYTYDITDEDKLKKFAVYHSEAGSGDRHLVFSFDGKIAYLACELDSTVEVLGYDDGHFSLLQKISTIPEDFTTFNGVAAIRLSSNGHFLYVSNRGHDSLATYSVSEDGKSLELIAVTKTEGHIPRDFNFSLDENFIIVAHQESDNLTLFERNQETGLLTLLQKDFYCPEGTCVLPIK